MVETEPIICRMFERKDPFIFYFFMYTVSKQTSWISILDVHKVQVSRKFQGFVYHADGDDAIGCSWCISNGKEEITTRRDGDSVVLDYSTVCQFFLRIDHTVGQTKCLYKLTKAHDKRDVFVLCCYPQ